MGYADSQRTHLKHKACNLLGVHGSTFILYKCTDLSVENVRSTYNNRSIDPLFGFMSMYLWYSFNFLFDLQYLNYVNCPKLINF
jgi:hypothetical protein